MLIGLCGGICAGKQSVADYLIKHHGFTKLRLADPTSREHDAPLSELQTAENGAGQYFQDIDSFLDFVTRRWQEKWVTTDVWNETILTELARRPFFLLVSVDAPVSLRWKRHIARCKALRTPPPSLEDFVLQNDAHLYSPDSNLTHILDRAEVRLINSTTSLSELFRILEKLDLLNPERLRPSWDQYFMQLASLAAQRSNCMKRRVGCVLVRDRRVISTGYNGTPRGIRNCNEGGCKRCNSGTGEGHGLSTCLCLHAEENALLEAGRERIREGTTLYCDTCPCLTCSVKIIQVGVSEVVYSQSYRMDQEIAAFFQEAGIKLRQFSPPRKGLVDLEALEGLP